MATRAGAAPGVSQASVSGVQGPAGGPGSSLWNCTLYEPFHHSTSKDYPLNTELYDKKRTATYLNTDQGSQFTSAAFTERVLAAGAQCSMDGRGRCLDNVFIERLWRSLKYEAVYLHELADGFAAERVIGAWMTFYGNVRPHSALGGRTPAEAYGEERAA